MCYAPNHPCICTDKTISGYTSQLGGITTDIGDLHYCITPTIMFNFLVELAIVPGQFYLLLIIEEDKISMQSQAKS